MTEILRMITTAWKLILIAGDRYRYRIRATYGMHYLSGNSAPYFSITATQERAGRRGGRWCDDACGCMHDAIAQHFPHLVPLIRWHLADQTGVPMHYAANAAYWFGKIGSPKERGYDPDPLGAFQSTVIFGAVEGDTMPASLDEVPAWCAARLPALREAFARDMAAAGVAMIPASEWQKGGTE